MNFVLTVLYSYKREIPGRSSSHWTSGNSSRRSYILFYYIRDV